MTKRIRVENADTAPYGVVVEVWDKGVEGYAPTLVGTINLVNPTDMTPLDLYITATRFLIVKEG